MLDTHVLQLTNFHLGRSQKEALKSRAKANGSNVAEEIRRAVDAYLAGVTCEELALLDAATRQAQTAIAEMNDLLEDTNRKSEAVFAEIAKLRGGWPEGHAVSVIADMLDRLSGVSALKERLIDTNKNVERSLAWMLDHEKRLIRLEAGAELAAPAVKKFARKRLPTEGR